MCKKERTWIEAVFYSMFTVGIITIILLIFPMLIWESRIYAPDWFIKWIDKMY